MVAGVELPIDESASALAMANAIFGAGATVNDARYFGWSESSGIYSDGDAVSPDVTPGDTGVILSTGRASDFANPGTQSNVRPNTSTNTPGVDNDAQFNNLAGGNTFDAAILEVDFEPTGDLLTMQFVFASEEYPEFVNSVFNDVVGVWINDTPVDLAVASGPTNVNAVNPGNNVNLYNDNTGDAFNTEMDGFTVTMTLVIPVEQGTENTLRIGIADVADSNFDSNLLIAGDSIQNQLILGDDEFDVVQGGTPSLDVLSNDASSAPGILTITHINNIPVTAGDTVTLTTGQQVTLNDDGSFDLLNDLDLESVTFTYTAEDSTGLSDTAFVTINTIPCFVAGTQIETALGQRPVEDLRPGDLIVTQDDGLQPLRWVGRRVTEADEKMAPVTIEAGALGPHERLSVSPQHRILLQDHRAELLFGEPEVLVAAKDLIDGVDICQIVDGRSITYVHLLFDRHQIIWSEGLLSESFLPGPMSLTGFDAEAMAEICALFPELDPQTGLGYGPSARPSLKRHEVQLLRGSAA